MAIPPSTPADGSDASPPVATEQPAAVDETSLLEVMDLEVESVGAGRDVVATTVESGSTCYCWSYSCDTRT